MRTDIDAAAGCRRIQHRLDACVGGQRDRPAEIHVVLQEAQRTAIGNSRTGQGQRFRCIADRRTAAVHFQRRAIGHRGPPGGRPQRVRPADLQRSSLDGHGTCEGAVVGRQHDPACSQFSDRARARDRTRHAEVHGGRTRPRLILCQYDVRVDPVRTRRPCRHPDTAAKDRQGVAGDVHAN